MFDCDFLKNPQGFFRFKIFEVLNIKEMFYISGTLKIHLNFFGYPMEIIYLQRLIKSHLMRVIAIFEITKEDVLKNLLNF